MNVPVQLRSIRPVDGPFLHEVHASIRWEVWAGASGTPEEKTRFVRMQIQARDLHDQAAFPTASSDVILEDRDVQPCAGA